MKKDIPVLAVLGFAFTGVFSFGLACALLLVRPDVLIGDPAQAWKLAFLHLVILGAEGSLLFAGAYLVGPLLAGAPLWSRNLANVHAHFHVIGLAMVFGGLIAPREDVRFAGSMIFFLGLLMLFLNLVKTGARRTVWTPSNIAFQAAMFWLLIGSAITLLYGKLAPAVGIGQLVDFYSYFILFGFLSQALLGVSLRLIPESLSAEGSNYKCSLDPLAWMGWTALNGGLLFLIPITFSGHAHMRLVNEGVIVFGLLCFVIHVLASVWKLRSRVSWGTITHATGLVLLLLLAVGTLYRLPGSDHSIFIESHEWTRFFVSLVLLGPFCFAIVGAAGRAVPRLIWQLRFAPWAEHGTLPERETLWKRGANAPVFFCLLIAWTYLFLGQWSVNSEAVRLGAMLLLTGFGWSVFYISPAIVRFVLGVTPADLHKNSPSTTKP